MKSENRSVIYLTFLLDAAQSRINGAPYEIWTQEGSLI